MVALLRPKSEKPESNSTLKPVAVVNPKTELAAAAKTDPSSSKTKAVVVKQKQN